MHIESDACLNASLAMMLCVAAPTPCLRLRYQRFYEITVLNTPGMTAVWF